MYFYIESMNEFFHEVMKEMNFVQGTKVKIQETKVKKWRRNEEEMEKNKVFNIKDIFIQILL